MTCPPAVLFLLVLFFDSKIKAERSSVRKAIAYLFNLQVKLILVIFNVCFKNCIRICSL